MTDANTAKRVSLVADLYPAGRYPLGKPLVVMCDLILAAEGAYRLTGEDHVLRLDLADKGPETLGARHNAQGNSPVGRNGRLRREGVDAFIEKQPAVLNMG